MERLYPYIVFLPKEGKQKILRAIFGSAVPVEILNFSIRQGLSEMIYQKDLIQKLGYSIKTIIDYLKTLTESGILTEHMKKDESEGRIKWLKVYQLSDLGRWFALLLTEEKTLSKEEKKEIVLSASRAYIGWIKNLYDSLGLDKKILTKLVASEAS
jgi:transposase